VLSVELSTITISTSCLPDDNTLSRHLPIRVSLLYDGTIKLIIGSMFSSPLTPPPLLRRMRLIHAVIIAYLRENDWTNFLSGSIYCLIVGIE
jgi:hypothetical protein